MPRSVQNGLDGWVRVVVKWGGGVWQNGGWKMFWHQIDKLISLFYLMCLDGISKPNAVYGSLCASKTKGVTVPWWVWNEIYNSTLSLRAEKFAFRLFLTLDVPADPQTPFYIRRENRKSHKIGRNARWKTFAIDDAVREDAGVESY